MKYNVWVNQEDNEKTRVVKQPIWNSWILLLLLIPFVGWAILIIYFIVKINGIKQIRSIELGLSNNGYIIEREIEADTINGGFREVNTSFTSEEFIDYFGKK